jgi:hypothetical protein
MRGKKKMICVKVTTENKYSWITSINGTLESAKDYFIGSLFNTGSFPGEVLSKVIKVELVR